MVKITEGVLIRKTDDKDTNRMFEIYCQKCTQDSHNEYLNRQTLTTIVNSKSR